MDVRSFVMNGSVLTTSLVDDFIQRWSDREGGQERAHYSLFLTELCDVLGGPHPDPADAAHEINDYVLAADSRTSPAMLGRCWGRG